ncbi:GMP synthase [glutamine-hydrolyzing] [Lentilactobacillus hilgardii]|uniref:GMP synthase [glutamine-hydrolyzing] n=1 Tax=Lentilactobacillus hilgardii (strain ATCC 8290 / DSM 20176 / CCUG 30140 / JCM 1155 / KCTC 3500 / NBRC 15886 / NCIMB 8040 / NRRL B-1843 / 9) TaxID=1423757 RepID=C0XH93_LENH9|nr:glutamine-hydrolyzing GMP synthase [Lentilactobacillus hilgardii]EEI19302.1 GMP synthase (glutamine-hydrolyzing) domain protein [Lentilactobacillus buchneri ATCC 11577]EEI25255.1 GMP synthase (glutamine-hydrolyzing) domain protein [Lentilactobacillus hilgardii DSM 20176 = ATCC 8290]MCT3395774.1 glutamine-hydrolyzing GMP synthase [Lentilactobacillus hilgardii]QEU39225.1 glutamine-hydrolyzing GMP synthase [Lentilactobacillus hilgardii]QIR10092.1 GMP synthase [glutamine-hydrolyzing] [Lentilact
MLTNHSKIVYYLCSNFERVYDLANVDLSSFDKILVLDFGSQYNQLITRRIRDLGVYSELKSHKLSANEIKQMNPKGIIFSGGPNSVYEEGALRVDPDVFKLGIPILGICYGMQLMAFTLDGKVEKADNSEYGHADIEVTSNDAVLFENTPRKQTVWMSHGDLVTDVPSGFENVATSEDCPISAMQDVNRNFYGIQFHAEVRNTQFGNEILKNFAFNVCHAKANWTMNDFIDLQIQHIRETVGDKKVLLGLSGGVDSSVVGVLLHKAIGSQLTSIFVDHGLLRKNEAQQVMDSLVGKFGLNIIKVDAQERFLSKLEGVTDPEKKRKIIGNEFIQVFNDEARKLDGIDFLAQGTLYTDVVESGTDTAQTIKSHHNVGGLPKDMKFKLIEPLNKLFKDEAREIGEKLGMPESLVWRQPFPGPGLGIRVLGEVTPDKLRIVRDSDFILRDEIAKAGLQRKVWQYFTVLPGFKSVGVMGDGRTYDYTVAIRAVNSVDGMTADFARLPWEILQKISTRIVNEVDGVNRIVYDVTSKPPSTIEWE